MEDRDPYSLRLHQALSAITGTITNHYIKDWLKLEIALSSFQGTYDDYLTVLLRLNTIASRKLKKLVSDESKF